MSKTPKANTPKDQEAPPAPATAPEAPAADVDATGQEPADNRKGESVPDPLADVGEEMPTVQQHAVEAHRAEAEGKANEQRSADSSGPVDSQGRHFDPALHEHDGNVPRLTTTGKLRCWRGGKSNGAQANRSRIGGVPKPGSAPGSTPVQPAQTQADLEAKIQSTAAVTAQMIFVVGQSLGGEEWAPKNANGMDERAMMHGAWAEYYRSQGITEIPPWAGLALVMGSYVGPRLFMPKTRTRLQTAREWLYGAIGRWKARRAGARRESNMRQDVQQELGV